MPRFRKQPVEIEAKQFVGGAENASPIIQWILDNGDLTVSYHHPDDYPGEEEYLSIYTLEGTMHAKPGDWIIRGVKGEFYPCKPDIFAETYEPVDENYYPGGLG